MVAPYDDKEESISSLNAAIDDLRAELGDAVEARDAARARVKELELGLKDVHALISESHGVAGLHLNGDVAPWDELLPGGRFEEWLCNFGNIAAPEAGEGGKEG